MIQVMLMNIMTRLYTSHTYLDQPLILYARLYMHMRPQEIIQNSDIGGLQLDNKPVDAFKWASADG